MLLSGLCCGSSAMYPTRVNYYFQARNGVISVCVMAEDASITLINQYR